MPDTISESIKTHWREMGQGPEQAFAIHCSLGHSGAWEGLADQLSDMVTMRAFDLPGHGGSSDWDGTQGYADLAATMAKGVMQPDGKIHLIGHSFGATLALRLAIENPERFASLTLIECVFFTIVRQDHPDKLPDDQQRRAPFADAMDNGEYETAARQFHGTWGDGRKWDEMTARQREGLTKRMPLIAAVQSSNNGDPLNMLASGALTRLPVPTLLIQGADSPPHIGLINDGLAARIPNTVRAEIPDAAHMAPITHPGPVAATLRSFLTNVTA
ncbi:MAG: alpha/beta fold hydrolase [Pseudooceanicola sp.]